MGNCCDRSDQYVQDMMNRIPKSSGIFREHSYDVVAYALRSHYHGTDNLNLGCTFQKVCTYGAHIQYKETWLYEHPRCPKLRAFMRKYCLCKRDNIAKESSRVNVYW